MIVKRRYKARRDVSRIGIRTIATDWDIVKDDFLRRSPAVHYILKSYLYDFDQQNKKTAGRHFIVLSRK